mgnify:FL=1
MTVNIEIGENIIDILSDGFVTCLKIRKPVAVDWYDCAGSVGKYFACTTDYELIAKQFNDILITGSDEEILNSISEFLKLFSSGQYSVFVDRNKRIEYELHYEYQKVENFENYFYDYYNPSGENVMFTQSKNKINNEVIKNYEKLILSGLRPKAVLFQAFFNDSGTYDDGSKWMSSFDSPKFILDGHHKLLAYKNLNVEPEYVLILKERIGQEEFSKNKTSLYFEYEYFLIDQSKQHILSHTPQLLVDNIDYNLQFDTYLCKTRRIETEVLILFKNALISNDRKKVKWLLDRLKVLESRNFETNNMWLNYHEISSEYPKGIWNGMEIKSKSDLNKWTVKIFGKSIEDIKNNIT